MAIAPRLELRQTQSLALTPQMQQAIRLLRMTNLELAEFVAEEAEKNPLLEVVAPTRPQSAPSTVGQAGGGDWNMLENIASTQSLYDHLHAQIGSMRLDAAVAEAALFLADELDEDGYLRVALGEVAERSGLPARAVVEGLARLQTCDPAGVGARNLKECLALQLRERDRLDPVIQTLIDNLGLAAQGRMPELAKLCGVDRDELDEMLEELRALEFQAGRAVRGSADPGGGAGRSRAARRGFDADGRAQHRDPAARSGQQRLCGGSRRDGCRGQDVHIGVQRERELAGAKPRAAGADHVAGLHGNRPPAGEVLRRGTCRDATADAPRDRRKTGSSRINRKSCGCGQDPELRTGDVRIPAVLQRHDPRPWRTGRVFGLGGAGSHTADDIGGACADDAFGRQDRQDAQRSGDRHCASDRRQIP